MPIVHHDAYHFLFSNMTPPEIVAWLNNNFWDGEYEITIQEKSVQKESEVLVVVNIS